MAKKQDIYLRKLKMEDVDFMLQMENDPEIWHVSQTEEPYRRIDIETFIKDSKHDLFEEFQLRYIIVLTENDLQIGSVDLFNFDPEANSAGIGITIINEFRGKSYGKQALKALVEIAFKKLKLKELYCNIFTDNEASIRLFESMGFERIKFLEKNTEFMGKKYDEYFYRLTKK